MLLNSLSKSFRIPSHKNLFVYTIFEVRMLVLSTSSGHRYIVVPSFVILRQSGYEFRLSFDKSADLDAQATFASKLGVWLQGIDKVCRRKIIFKGLGYKATLSENRSKLNLKLGFSHALGLVIPTDRVNIKIVKNAITILGHDRTEVGNFARRIHRFRTPDAYKGKGVWYKNERRSLKELRKK